MSAAKKHESPSDAALSRVRAVCHGFPGAEEKLSHGAPSFHVRGKMFLNLLTTTTPMDASPSGASARSIGSASLSPRIPIATSSPLMSACAAGSARGSTSRRPTGSSSQFSSRRDGSQSPPPSSPAEKGRDPGLPRPPLLARPQMRKVARDALERLTKSCLALPDATREREARHASFLVGKKTFVYFLDNHHGDSMILACVRGDRAENAKLVKRDPKRYCSPAYIGKRGWLGIRLEAGRVDWKGIAERVGASYQEVAPKKRAGRAAAGKG